MISGETTVIVERVQLRVARVSYDQEVATVVQRGPAEFAVISAGLQGPVGTVAENVLERAAAAEKAAAVAAGKSDQTAEDVSTLVSKLNGAFAYYAGVIEA